MSIQYTHGNKLQVASKVTVLVRTKKLCSPTPYQQRICKSKSCPLSSKIKKNPDYQKVCFPKLFRFNKVSGFCIPLLLGKILQRCSKSPAVGQFPVLRSTNSPPPPLSPLKAPKKPNPGHATDSCYNVIIYVRLHSFHYLLAKIFLCLMFNFLCSI